MALAVAPNGRFTNIDAKKVCAKFEKFRMSQEYKLSELWAVISNGKADLDHRDFAENISQISKITFSEALLMAATADVHKRNLVTIKNIRKMILACRDKPSEKTDVLEDHPIFPQWLTARDDFKDYFTSSADAIQLERIIHVTKLSSEDRKIQDLGVLAGWIKKNHILSQVKMKSKLIDICRKFKLMEFPANAQICAQGDMADAFYIILSGTVDVVIDGNYITSFRSGASFGEKALESGVPRTASVFSAMRSQLLCLTASEYKAAMASSGQSGVPNGALEFLRANCPGFKSVNMSELFELTRKMTMAPFSDGDIIMKQGEISSNMCIVMKGSVKVVRTIETASLWSEIQSTLKADGGYTSFLSSNTRQPHSRPTITSFTKSSTKPLAAGGGGESKQITTPHYSDSNIDQQLSVHALYRVPNPISDGDRSSDPAEGMAIEGELVIPIDRLTVGQVFGDEILREKTSCVNTVRAVGDKVEIIFIMNEDAKKLMHQIIKIEILESTKKLRVPDVDLILQNENAIKRCVRNSKGAKANVTFSPTQNSHHHDGRGVSSSSLQPAAHRRSTHQVKARQSINISSNLEFGISDFAGLTGGKRGSYTAQHANMSQVMHPLSAAALKALHIASNGTQRTPTQKIPSVPSTASSLPNLREDHLSLASRHVHSLAANRRTSSSGSLKFEGGNGSSRGSSTGATPREPASYSSSRGIMISKTSHHSLPPSGKLPRQSIFVKKLLTSPSE